MDKILIATRGELVPRLIKYFDELDIRYVTVYSKEEPDMPQIKLVKPPNKTVCIGPYTNYSNVQVLLNIAKEEEVDGIYRGFGFLSEIPAATEVFEKNGIETFSTSAKSMELWKDRLTAKKIAEKFGFENVPGTDKVVKSADDVKGLMEEHGPIILKGSGGGGKVTEVVYEFNENEINKTLEKLRSREESFFGSEKYNICAEKFLTGQVSHLEIQIVGDKHGNFYRIGRERDCSLQRNYQKVIEETPSTKIAAEKCEELGKRAIEAAKATELTSLNTFEILHHAGKNYFNEDNTRIQVEHGITEETTGIDLLKTQIEIGLGKKLLWSQEEIDKNTRGHAIECRILARDLTKQMGNSGTITHYRRPETPNTRFDTTIFEGCAIPMCFDTKIANLIVKEKTRREAIERMKQALENTVIRGEKTLVKDENNREGKMNFSMPSLIKILETEEFVNGTYHTRSVENLVSNPDFVKKVKEKEEDIERIQNLLLSFSYENMIN